MEEGGEIAKKQAETELISALISKVDRTIMPFICLLEIISYFTRTSIGHAKLMGIDENLNISQNESNWAISLFALAYFIFAIPSHLFLRFLGTSSFLSVNILTWGGITVGMAFVTDARELLVVRFLIGMVESGFFPGIVVYFSFWYRRKEQTMRMAILFAAAIASNALSSVLAYGFAHMQRIRGLEAWRWMFLVEGLPLIPLAAITYFFLAKVTDGIQFLNPVEKLLLSNLLYEDAGAANNDPFFRNPISWRQVRYVFVDYRIYMYGMITIGNLGVIKYWTTYLPLLLGNMSSGKPEAHLWPLLVYTIACVSCLLINYSASHRNEHGFHLVFCFSIALLGFILRATSLDQNRAVMFVSTCIAYSGVYAAFPLVLSWLTINVGGLTKRAMAIVVVIAEGQLGGIVLPHVCSGGNPLFYRRDHLICSGIMVVTIIVTIILRVALQRENKRRKNFLEDNSAPEINIEEPGDWSFTFVYTM